MAIPAGHSITDHLNSVILFQARSRLCVLPIPCVVETMRPLPIEALAGAPDFVLGASLVRGAVTPVVDVGVLVGAKETPAFTRYIVVRAGQRRVALAVEAVLGARELPDAVSSQLPPLLREASAEAIALLGALDGELLTVLNLAQRLTQAILQTVETPGAAV